MSNTTHAGKVEWIGLRGARDEPMQAVEEVAVDARSGLQGDRYRSSGPEDRQVTFVQQEHLPVVAALLGLSNIDPKCTRRNILISGINLLSFENHQFRIGDCLFLFSGPCEPCSRMNKTIGPGGMDAMAGHGGIMARVVRPGTIRIGDPVTRVERTEVE